RAIGGMWDEIGLLQYDFLLHKGLQPCHSLLDIGCGTLRGGRHFIRYLTTGKYCGIDISPKAIEYARELVIREGLSEKQARLVVNEERHLRFEKLVGETFDYILAQSVFTHLKPEHIRECFEHLGRVMHDASIFYFTYFKHNRIIQTSH